MKEASKLIYKSVLAGLLIAFAGALFLQCDNKIMGSLLFSLGLVGVILLEANLYTGKIGYVDSWKAFGTMLLMLLINLVIAFLVGLLFRTCIGMAPAADARLLKEWYRILWDAIICGMCVFLSVELYKRTKNIFIIMLPVIAFILTGGEHCIAYTFYMGAGVDTLSLMSFGYLGLMIVGNSVGAILLRLLIGRKK